MGTQRTLAAPPGLRRGPQGIDSGPLPTERRYYLRFPIRQSCRVEFPDGSDRIGQTIEMSLGNALVAVQSECARPDPVRLRLPDPHDDSAVLTLSGRIARGGSGTLAMEFDVTGEEINDLLQLWLDAP